MSSREKPPTNETYTKRRCGGDNDDFLTERQKTLVRQTWSLLADDLVTRGSMIFLYIFKKRPSTKELFPFRDVEGDALLRNPMFKGHGKRFMHAVETTVKNIDALDIIIVPTLYQLGKRHAYITDYFVDYQTVFREAILATFEEEMGSACTAEVRQAWTLLFEFIATKLLEGYAVGMEDRRLAKEAEAAQLALEANPVDRQAPGENSADNTKCPCPVSSNGDVKLATSTDDNVGIVLPNGISDNDRRSAAYPPCKLPLHLSGDSVGVAIASRTVDTVTTTNTTTASGDAAITATTNDGKTAPLATLDETPTSLITIDSLVTNDDTVTSPTSVTPVTPDQGSSATASPVPVDEIQPSTTSPAPFDHTLPAAVSPASPSPAPVAEASDVKLEITSSVSDEAADQIRTLSDTTAVSDHSSDEQTALIGTPETTNAVSTEVSQTETIWSPATENSDAKSGAPTDRGSLGEWTNYQANNSNIVRSPSDCQSGCITMNHETAMNNLDHDSNGGLRYTVYSSCNGANVISDVNDVGRMLQANTV